jgi:predicted acetyltransferase
MTTAPAKLFTSVAVIPAAREQERTLANLLELYVHDFSEFCELETGPDGKFGYPHLALYWSEAGRHPFLLKVDGKLAGLSLVRRGSQISGDASVWDMAEFFVLRAYRRRGIGIAAAHQVWKQLPGRWEVRVMECNIPALYFWSNAIEKFAGVTMSQSRIERGRECWQVFQLESKAVTDSASWTKSSHD